MEDKTFNISTPEIDIYAQDEVIIFKSKSDVFNNITNPVFVEKITKLFRIIKVHKSVKAILLTAEPDVLNQERYNDFLKRILSDSSFCNEDETPDFVNKSERIKELNVLNRIINQLADFQKLVFIGLQGEIVTPFFGASLSADFRFATGNMSFLLSHGNYGLHPSGALPFFLSRYLHHSKATELLIKGGRISSVEALELGLINKILPEEGFIDACIDEIKKVTTICQSTLRNTKRLINFSRKQLKDYFEFEETLLYL